MSRVQPQLWQQIIQHVVAHGGSVIRPWFTRLEPVSLEHGLLEIQVPGAPEQSYCQQRATRLFTDAAQVSTGHLVSVCFLAGPPAPLPEVVTIQDPTWQSELILNHDYTFDTFVTGPCNRLAQAACMAVADSPGKTYNPLFIHGSSGLGKTHLLQATCQTLARTGFGKILFLSCESFINHLIEAIQTGKLHDFRYRYRQLDVLVVDDMQFLANHDQTQEEFFHTFNTLYQTQKQIILSCDRPPSDIPHLEERLISRFNWGLVTGIDRPGYETRVAIVQKKALSRGIAMPDDVACFIAGTIDSNARELEGAITKISMLSRVLDRPIEMSLAEEAMSSDMPARNKDVTVERIIDMVVKRFNVRLSDLQSRKRSKSISLPRQVCMYLARSLTRHSLEEIGGYFGGRDHTTVLHANRAIGELRKEDPVFHARLEQISQELKQTK